METRIFKSAFLFLGGLIIFSHSPVYCSSSLSSQKQSRVDSLENIIKNSSQKPQLIKAHNALSELYRTVGSYPKAREHARKAFKLSYRHKIKSEKAKALNNLGLIDKEQGNYEAALTTYQKSKSIYKTLQDTPGLADLYHNIGTIHSKKDQYDKALHSYKRSLALDLQLGDSGAVAASYNNIGIIYHKRGNYAKALSYYQQSAHLKEKRGDQLALANTYNNMGIIQRKQGRYDKAQHYYEKCLSIYKREDDKEGMASSYNNLGIIAQKQGQYKDGLRKHKRSLQIYTDLGSQRGKALTYSLIGNTYLKLTDSSLSTSDNPSPTEISSHQTDYLLDSAQYYLKRAVNLQQSINALEHMAYSLTSLGDILYKKEAFPEALPYYKQAVIIADSIGNQPQLYRSYRGLSQTYAALDRYQAAYRHHVNYARLQDSVHSRESQEQIAEMEEKYHAEKRKRQIKVLEKEKQLQKAQLRQNRLLLYSAGGGLLIVLVFSGLLYNRFRVTYRQKQVIEQQKSTVEEQKAIVDQKNREITASINYAQRIQEALLKEEEHVTPDLPPHFVLFKPHSIVSGDFYWSVLKGDEWYVAVADCTGHGVPGALLTMLGTAFLNEITAAEKNIEPGLLLKHLRERFVKELQKEQPQKDDFRLRDGMDISLLRVNLGTLTAQWSGANNPLYIIRKPPHKEIDAKYKRHTEYNGYDLYELPPHHQHIGYVKQPEPFPTYKVQLKKDDALYLFSDGYPDQFGGPKGKKFMYTRFKRKLMEITEQTMEIQKNQLDKTIENWMAQNNEEQIDDICVLGINIK